MNAKTSSSGEGRGSSGEGTHGPLDVALLDADARHTALTAYLDGELSADDARRVTAWLDDHPEALRDIEHQRRVWDLLETYGDEPVADRFADGVFEAVDIRRDTGTGGRVIQLAWYRRPLVAAAAGMLLALGASFGFSALRGDSQDQGQPSLVVVATEDLSTLEAVPSDLLLDTAALEFLATLDDEHFDAFVDGEYEPEEDAG